MTGDCHVQFGERLAGQFRWPTHLDFRVILKPAALTIGKETRRNHLRKFRHALIGALSNAGFLVAKDQIKVFYEGRFMSIRAEFEGSAGASYLKPHIAPQPKKILNRLLDTIALSQG